MLAPDGTRVRAPLRGLAEAVRGEPDARLLSRLDRVLERAAVAASRRDRTRGALFEEMMADRSVDIGWSVGLPPSSPFPWQLRGAGVFAAARTMLAMQLLQQALGIAGWWLVGRGALEGQLVPGWLAAWGLVLLSVIPARVVGDWAQGSAALGFALLLKRRLLNGALRLEPEEVRRQGSGEVLGRVIESSAVESLVTTGGLAALLAGVEAIVAAAVLFVPPAGWTTALAFTAYVVLVFAVAAIVGRRIARWTQVRMRMTRDLVERMLGHRTRLAQEPRDRWHEAEDEQLAQYAEQSASLDRTMTWLQSASPRMWLVVGVAALAPGFVRGESTGAMLAVSIGGLILGYRAIARLASGITSLLRARVAWVQARPLFEAGGREEQAGSASWAAARGSPTSEVLLDARDLHFRYPERHQPVLRGVDLKIAPRERLLLEGPSGGGKSTLAALLTGLRTPDAGLLLLGGVDRETLGDSGWRRRVVAAPQFHENHVVGASLAFNLLMGRSWPPREADLKEAQEVCEDLGLGPLLERMPSGLMQLVGETGWQLSHGEKSRVFVARALLQKAEMIVLDESFAALDPETLERALRCVQRRAPALVVIAHP
jgi:ATP-binding cassette subfamily B protein